MKFDRSGENESQFMQALVPMVDLSAVLAVVFMIHSDNEITSTKLESEEARKRLETIDEAEQARRERRELLARKASKSLEETKKRAREKSARVIDANHRIGGGSTRSGRYGI